MLLTDSSFINRAHKEPFEGYTPTVFYLPQDPELGNHNLAHLENRLAQIPETSQSE